MKLIDLKGHRFHWSEEAQRKWVYAALVAAAVIAGLIALGWSLGIGIFEDWGLFEE